MVKKTGSGSKGKTVPKPAPKTGKRTVTRGKVRSYGTGSTGPKSPAKKGK